MKKFNASVGNRQCYVAGSVTIKYSFYAIDFLHASLHVNFAQGSDFHATFEAQDAL